MLKNSVDSSLVKIGRIHHAHKKYNIFTSTRPINKLKQQILSLNKDESKLLSGSLCSIKDNIATKQEYTTCSSSSLRDYKSPFSATVVDLLEKHGSIVIGKTNLDEFGMGANNSYSHIGQTLNPMYDDNKDSETFLDADKYVPGGSSGGSAAAVSAGVCDFALGTDTGGSVRLPAAYCGVHGFKPSYGRISRWGVVAYAQSLDTVGILGSNLEIIKSVYNVLNQYDTKDPTCIDNQVRSRITALTEKLTSIDDAKKINIGISTDYLAKGVTPDTLATIELLASKLFGSGYNIVPVKLPSLSNAVPAYFTIAYSEATSNLSRYDGVRYGYSTIEAGKETTEDYKSFISKTRSEGFGAEVQKRILIGNYNLSSEKFQNNYLKAGAVRKKLTAEFNSIFKLPNALYTLDVQGSDVHSPTKVDFIIAPISASRAPKLSDLVEKEKSDPISTYVNDAFVIPSSLAGLPSISLPWYSNSEKYPVGIQLIGQYGDDQRVLEFAKRVEELNSF
ncbi:glutamyl-tRNA(Gln) amidotransferase subunit [Saccharomycopsis crataegensis]|uniref:Glutamyl-tRNA(Gln) amidotransferase subunit A, mitochondrial n=1 Tax=Saccharomycopsis crataegensis TaxID=43959 RepID=A0AAV5QHR9_9ASCO|nr:glutamyl-tRNA(Gln) amidotransferase subunit [Saccharomycopsis crataegensis]